MSSELLFLKGQSSISPFRLRQLNRQRQHAVKAVTDLFVVQLKMPLENVENMSTISGLLGTDSPQGDLKPGELIIAPRAGTISPWSSKATDIFERCREDTVQRVEKARVLRIDCENVRELRDEALAAWHDPMTESVFFGLDELHQLFTEHLPAPVREIDIRTGGKAALEKLNRELGLALSDQEVDYLLTAYGRINRNPTDAELMMFAQANSEHCRHKIFNAHWTIDGQAQPKSLFAMIRNTEANTLRPALSAYKDNAAVFSGGPGQRWLVEPVTSRYQRIQEPVDVLIKVETHNHPTAISPFPGAATGSGGEIRDEAATGQGAKPKAGLTGFSVSHLRVPGWVQPWESDNPGKPGRITSALDIMLEGPIGGAAFNNEFGRPNLTGYFRTFEWKEAENRWRGYHKPIMLAGGLGNIRPQHVQKGDTRSDDIMVVLGGPAMLIGLGGGAASSVDSGSGDEQLDFASVQRGNPEMQRRAQEVIDRCWALGTENPIRSIHDVGAGGLSNAMPELLHDGHKGGWLELRELDIAQPGMSPMEIWCNESQERYVLSIRPEKLEQFKALCARENCPVAIMGTACSTEQLTVHDAEFDNNPVDIPMLLLFGNTPATHKDIRRQPQNLPALDLQDVQVEEAMQRVLAFPAVASKQFLITIGDRSVGGLVYRDQMVGPWQVPVADQAITLRDFDGYAGEAMAVGERTPVALINGPAAGRLAVIEALTNLASAPVGELAGIKLSANWMAACGKGREDEILFDTVKAVGEELCPALGIGIPVGKDSLSMHMQWQQDGQSRAVTAPVSLVVSAFASLEDVRGAVTPQIGPDQHLWLLDLGQVKDRLGGSVLAQVYQQLGNEAPDLDDADLFMRFWRFMQEALQQRLLAAAHDRSDGGLWASVAEMAFVGQQGLNLEVPAGRDVLPFLFAEEPGMVVSVATDKQADFARLLEKHGLEQVAVPLGQTQANDILRVHHRGEDISARGVSHWQKIWAENSHRLQRLRDNPACADEEFAQLDTIQPPMQPEADFDFSADQLAPFVNSKRPQVAILREQGVNGQLEMAMAFERAGFEPLDVHMQDLIDGRFALKDFVGLAACGGFSYGDVLGAGQGWAKGILFDERLRQQFGDFFADPNRFALGVCNGCQMLSSLKTLIPGSEHWPRFVRNRSEQFEARFSQLEIQPGNSLFFAGMAGARIPVAIAHGEGRAAFAQPEDRQAVSVAARYVDNAGQPTQIYPFNPNGSEAAVAAVSNRAGNVLIMMPHPERVFRSAQMSWAPPEWGENSPWMRMFYNARKFIG